MIVGAIFAIGYSVCRAVCLDSWALGLGSTENALGFRSPVGVLTVHFLRFMFAYRALLTTAYRSGVGIHVPACFILAR